jgi:hypothetical protein
VGRDPQLIVLTTIQSALWLPIFRYIFGGAINADGLPYVAFLVPGVVVTNTLFSGMGAAAGGAEDLEQGFYDRLRSLVPVSSMPGWMQAFATHQPVTGWSTRCARSWEGPRRRRS